MVEKAKAHLLSWLLPTLGTLALGAGLLLEENLQKYVPEPQPLWAVRAIAVSLLLLCLLVASYFLYRPKFKHLKHLGVHQNIKTGEFVCSHCLITKKLNSPLKTLENNLGWQCSACDKWEKNPEYVAPPTPKVEPRERI